MKYVFVDFEMQKIDKIHKEKRAICKQEIIEIGAIMLDEEYNEISTFKRYVKPVYSKHISRQITELTGITDNYLFCRKNVAFEMEEFAKWCLSFNDEIRVYAWSENDLKQITEEFTLKEIEYSDNMNKIIASWIDLQAEYDKAVGASKPTSLNKALESVGIYFQGHMHDALDDSRNTAIIFKELSDPESFQESISYIKNYVCDSSSSGTTLGELIDFSKINICA